MPKLTPETLALTAKYSDEYTEYCKNRECGETCPVFVEHQTNKVDSCFLIYARFRESGIIQQPTKKE